MNTRPSPPAGSRSRLNTLSVETSIALDDALCEIAEDKGTKHEAKGVLPIWHGADRYPSMSLGTSRFCNDHNPAARTTEFEQAITGIDGSVPIACLEWSRVTFYREAIRSTRSAQRSMFTSPNLTRGIFNGYMSPATRRKVRKSVSTWIRSIMLYRADVKKQWDPGRAYPVFVTVTLPVKQAHGDAEINRKVLQPFIQRLKREYGIENYFWRAEAQDNGNLHYHLLVDRYIPKEALQLMWNMSTEALGYLTSYFEQTGSIYPPSTEIHRIKTQVKDRKTGKLKDVDPVDYLIDYVMDVPQPIDEPVTDAEGNDGPVDPDAKEKPARRKLIGKYRDKNGEIKTYETRPIEGRVWGMSDTLREIREPRAEATVEMVTAFEKAKDQGLLRRLDLEHATMYFGPVGLVLSRSSPSAWKLMKEYYLQVFGHLYPQQLPQDYVRDHPPQDPRNLWIDFEHAALYHRLKLETESPAFETAAQLDQWMEQQMKKHNTKQAAA